MKKRLRYTYLVILSPDSYDQAHLYPLEQTSLWTDRVKKKTPPSLVLQYTIILKNKITLLK